MKLIKITNKGSLHFEMSDGRLGAVYESGYVRVSTKTLNQYNSKSKLYQINKKTSYVPANSEYSYSQRELLTDNIDRIKLLYKFNQKNCQ